MNGEEEPYVYKPIHARGHENPTVERIPSHRGDHFGMTSIHIFCSYTLLRMGYGIGRTSFCAIVSTLVENLNVEETDFPHTISRNQSNDNKIYFYEMIQLVRTGIDFYAIYEVLVIYLKIVF